MPEYEFLDAFPDFMKVWASFQNQSLDDQIEGWHTVYMSQWPELLAKQIGDYAKQNLDWRQIAREKVFPYLAERLPAMQEAHDQLLKSCAPINAEAQRKFGFSGEVIFVIYVGIGCGAGWVTPFRDLPAILFGLENIAECGWNDAASIKGLVAHEFGHLLHYHWREQVGKPIGSGPWWQLYEEGFAQFCEHLILDHDTWHQSIHTANGNWLDWCESHRAWLAAEFLKTVDSGNAVSPFFGSWFEIEGRSETGYFLGHEVIVELNKIYDIKTIALLDEVETFTRPILEQLMGQVG